MNLTAKTTVDFSLKSKEVETLHHAISECLRLCWDDKSDFTMETEDYNLFLTLNDEIEKLKVSELKLHKE